MSQSRKKIGILIGYQFAYNTQNLVSNLARLIGDSFQLDLIGDLDLNGKLKSSCNVYWYSSHKSSQKFSLLDFKNLFVNCYKYTRLENPDLLIHLNSLSINGTIASITGKLTGIPVIVRHSGGEIHSHKFATSWYKKMGLYLLKNVLIKAPLLLSDKIITLGPRLKAEINSKRGDKIVIIPQPIDQKKFHPPMDRAKFKKKLDIPVNKKMILFVGRLEETKGMEQLFPIISRVNRESDHFIFYLIGDGSYREQFSKFENSSVRVIRQASPEEIDNYYKAADLLIHPTLKDGLPNVILEALACKIPVVASPVGEIPTYVSNIYEDVDDYVNFILSKDWEPNSLPNIFSEDKLAQRYRKVFNKAIAENRQK